MAEATATFEVACNGEGIRNSDVEATIAIAEHFESPGHDIYMTCIVIARTLGLLLMSKWLVMAIVID